MTDGTSAVSCGPAASVSRLLTGCWLMLDPHGTDLRWTLNVEEPAPADALVGHLRKRLNQLINANLRFTFGQ
jgi:hypothetical protein